MQRRVFLGGVACLAAAGCTAPAIYATDEEIARYAYAHPGPKSLTLFTMINNETGVGAHSSIMINASQRVVFDPAGSVNHPRMPERHDVLYGFSPRIADVYARAHARRTYHVVILELDVPADRAEAVFDRVREIGPIRPAQCTLSISTVLREEGGMPDLPRTWFPKTLMEAFEQLPGVKRTVLREDDADDKAIAIAELDQVVIYDISEEAAAGAAAEASGSQTVLETPNALDKPVARR